MTTIHIEGMSCAHCAAAVHKALEALGLTGVQVDATRGEAVFAGTVDREELRRAIAASRARNRWQRKPRRCHRAR